MGALHAEFLIPPGLHWIVTCPNAFFFFFFLGVGASYSTRPTSNAGLLHLDAISTASFKQSVEAFLSIGIRRLQPLVNMDHQAILLESTFHNATAASSLPTDNARSKVHQA